MKGLSSLVASLAVPFALYACANGDDAVPGPKNRPVADPSASGEGGVADAPIDQAVLDPAPCMQAELDAPANADGGDNSATPAATPIEIDFPMNGAAVQYTNHCLKVKVGAKVTFKGNFVPHPLEPKGGNMPTPIPSQSTQPAGDAITLTMSTAGKFGYRCAIHTGLMFGAIQVVP